MPYTIINVDPVKKTANIVYDKSFADFVRYVRNTWGRDCSARIDPPRYPNTFVINEVILKYVSESKDYVI